MHKYQNCDVHLYLTNALPVANLYFIFCNFYILFWGKLYFFKTFFPASHEPA